MKEPQESRAVPGTLVLFAVLTVALTAITYSRMDGSGVGSFIAALLISAVISAVVAGLLSLGWSFGKKQ